jgi:hypothetical protein
MPCLLEATFRKPRPASKGNPFPGVYEDRIESAVTRDSPAGLVVCKATVGILADSDDLTILAMSARDPTYNPHDPT